MYYSPKQRLRQPFQNAVHNKAPLETLIFHYGLKRSWLSSGHSLRAFSHIDVFFRLCGDWVPAQWGVPNGFVHNPLMRFPPLDGSTIYVAV